MLKFNGVAVKEPKSITVSPEKIWSSNTGRGDNGKMTGDVVAIKVTLKIEWAVLTAEEIETIDACLSEPFFECTFLNPRSGNQEETKTFYAGTPTYPVYSYVKGYPEYTGIGVDLIEQ